MRNAIIILLAILTAPSLLLGAEWEEHGVTVVSTAPSVTEGAMRHALRDANGRSFAANYAAYPDKPSRERAIALKDLFFGWRHILPERLEFFFAADGTYANMQTTRIEWQGENLRPYLPAGLAFHDARGELYYRFRIVVKDTSYKLDGKYSDEETLLKEIYGFIRAVEEGKISETDLVRYRYEEPKKEAPKKELPLRLSAFVLGNYLTPTGDFAKIFSGGYGGMAGVTLHNVGISMHDKTLFRVDLSLAAGYWGLERKKDPDPEVTGEVRSSYVVPIIFTARYRIDVIGALFVAPSLGVGIGYHSLCYSKIVANNRRETCEVGEWAPSLSAGLMAGYSLFNDTLMLMGGADYIVLFERQMTCMMFAFYIGAGYVF